MAATMRAVVVTQPGPPAESLRIADDVPRPPLPPNALLVRVAHTALNRADTLQRRGLYPPPPGASETLGLELSGVVEEVGEGAPPGKWRKGDRVAGLVSGGAYAELCVVEEPLAMRLPEAMPLALAASIPEAWLTAYQLLHVVGKIQAGDTVLVHAAGSGVGLAALQLARAAGAARVLATASAAKLQFLREEMGLVADAAHAIDYTTEGGNWAGRVKAAAAGSPSGGVDVVLDCVAGQAYFHQNLDVLGRGGRYVLYGTMAGSVVPEVDLRVVMRKALEIRGTTLRARPLAYKAELVRAFWTEERARAFLSGALTSRVHATFDWARVAEAHAMMEANENIGKIVLAVDPSLK